MFTNKIMRFYTTLLFAIVLTYSYSQAPVIEKIEPSRSFPNERIVITGSGFSATPAQLRVLFGSVAGTVVSSSEFGMEVTVPPQARLDNIEVINLTSRLSGKSRDKFMPVFSGEGFNPAKLATPVTFAGERVFDLCTCDFDGDGKPDIAGAKDATPSNDLIVLRNTSTAGNLSFTKLDKTNLPVLQVNSQTGNISCGDLTGDGKPEIIASGTLGASNRIYVLQNTSTVGSISFAAPVTLTLDNTSELARQTFLRDLNGDGKPEIVVTNSFNNQLYIYLNQSSGGTLTINTTPTKIAMVGVPNSLALEIQDFDNDGKADIALIQSQNANLYILKNQSSGGTIAFTNVPFTLNIAGSFNAIQSADFNRDGKQDIVLTSVFNARTLVLLNQSTTSFSFSTNSNLTTDTGPFGLDIADINGDGFADIIVPCRGTNVINVFLHNTNATPGFTKVNVPTVKNNWFVKVSDFDGDAKPDLAYTTFNGTQTQFSIDIVRNTNCHLPQILNDQPITICPAQTIQLKTINIPAVTFEWSDGVTTTSTGATPTFNIIAAGNYTVTATGEGGTCAVSSAVLNVTGAAGTAPANPVITSNAPLCVGSTLNLGTGTVVGATYIWEGPNGFTSALEDPSIPDITRSDAGLYTLKVRVGNCTSNETSLRVDVVDLASFNVTSNSTNPVCEGANVTLTVNSVSGHSYEWFKDNVTTGITGSTLTLNGISTAQEGLYKVRVTRTSPSCVQETGELQVGVVDGPTAAFTASKTDACVGETVSFTNQSTVDGSATVAYAWDFDDGGSATSANSSHFFTTPGTYQVSLTVNYNGVTGCSSTIAQDIEVDNAVIPQITSDVSEICVGEEAVLSVTGSFNSFTWSTGASTSSITVTNPGLYTVDTQDANGCPGEAQLEIQFKDDCGQPGAIAITPLKIFTPNGDTQNDFWTITGVENYQDCTMTIFDGRGRKILEQTNYPTPPSGWDGRANGNEVPAGTYYYVFGCPNGTSVTGSVLIIRK